MGRRVDRRLRRLLGALAPTTLRDLAEAYELDGARRRATRAPALADADALAAHPEVTVEEVVGELLDDHELGQACRALGIAGDWPREALVARLLDGLSSWLPFSEARSFARSLGLASRSDWTRLARGVLRGCGPLPPDVPGAPDRVYREAGWKGWDDFLGHGHVATSARGYLRYESARRFARSLCLGSEAAWRASTRGDRPELPALPAGVPRAPDGVYRAAGWMGWGDFLGTGRRPPVRGPQRLSFAEARRVARSLGLSGAADWRRYIAGGLPDRPPPPPWLPRAPSSTYRREGWAGWCDFLGLPAPRSGRRRTASAWRSFAAERSSARLATACEEHCAPCPPPFPQRAAWRVRREVDVERRKPVESPGVRRT